MVFIYLNSITWIIYYAKKRIKIIRRTLVNFVKFVSICMQVLSVNLDEWTHEEVNIVIKCGGNPMVNYKYEASIPGNCRKPKTDSSIEERLDFIR